MEGLIHFFWLVLFVALGFPVALAIELYLRGRRPPAEAYEPLHDNEFMPVPPDSAVARRLRTAAPDAGEPSLEQPG
jgi:hypothetical protein